MTKRMSDKGVANYLQLLPGEREILSCRTHWKNYVPSLVGAVSSAAFAVARLILFGRPFLFNLEPYFGRADYGTVSLLETGAALFLVFWFTTIALRHLMVRYVITSERLIHHSGFFSTRTTELKLCYCSNLILVQSLAGRVLNYGDFKLRAGGVDMFFNDVPKPLVFKRKLAEAINECSLHGTSRRLNAIEYLEDELGLS